jgi:hypothetical protein
MDAMKAFTDANGSEREKQLMGDLVAMTSKADEGEKALNESQAALSKAHKELASAERAAVKYEVMERDLHKAKDGFAVKDLEMQRYEATIMRHMEDQDAALTEVQSDKEALMSQHKADRVASKHDLAIRQVATVLAGIMRCEKATAFHAMRTGLAEDVRDYEIDALYQLSDEQLRSAAVRQMRAWMIRLAQGLITCYVDTWRSKQKYAMIRNADAKSENLKEAMRAAERTNCVVQLALILRSFMMARQGVALHVMRSAYMAHVRDREHRKAELMHHAEKVYMTLAQQNIEDDVVRQSELVNAHGGDFGLFKKVDASETGEITLTEWMDYMTHVHTTKEALRDSKGQQW